MRVSFIHTIFCALFALQACSESEQRTTSDQTSDSIAQYTFDLEYSISSKLNLNLNIVRDFESLDTNVYWPGGLSGPTIGVGIDLGHTGKRNIERVFKGIVDTATLRTLLSAAGVHGKAAASWVAKNNVSITKSVANLAFLRTCQIYWGFAASRFGPEVQNLDPSVKGALLSLLMNYGPYSKHLNALERYVKLRDMRGLAVAVRCLQNSNKNKNIRDALARRRKLEHDVILLAAREQPERVVMD